MSDISLRGLLQSSKLAQGRRKSLGGCIRVAIAERGRLFFLCMIVFKASGPES